MICVVCKQIEDRHMNTVTLRNKDYFFSHAEHRLPDIIDAIEKEYKNNPKEYKVGAL